MLFRSNSGILPPGLSLDSLTGYISGTASTPGAYHPVIKVQNSGGNDTEAVHITVQDTAPSTLTYTTPVTYTKGTPIDTNHAVVTGGHANLVFTLNAGSLPVGLTLNSSTGHITGAVTGASGDYTAVIRTTNSGGYAQDTVEITVIDTAPAVLAYTQLSPTFTVGTAITPDTALVTRSEEHTLNSSHMSESRMPSSA